MCTADNPYGLSSEDKAIVDYAMKNIGSGIKASDLSFYRFCQVNFQKNMKE